MKTIRQLKRPVVSYFENLFSQEKTGANIKSQIKQQQQQTQKGLFPGTGEPFLLTWKAANHMSQSSR